MKYFLWFKLDKLKTDIDYFLVTFLSISTYSLIKILSYIFDSNKNINFSHISVDIIILIFWLWLVFVKKDFSFLKVISKLFFIDLK